MPSYFANCWRRLTWHGPNARRCSGFSGSSTSGYRRYMETPELESALERVKELGGTAGEIRDIPPLLTAELPSAALHGRFAGCKDSEGIMFHLWQRNPEN
jgi:predicted enzyme related to lactoylglutathione lyase